MALPDRKRVLIIDDEPLVARAIVRTLRDHFDVDLAAGGREAIALLAAGTRFDAILCDLMLGDSTGMDFYGALQRIAPDQQARVVFLTGGAFTTQARNFLAQGQRPCLEKPLSRELLLSTLQELVDGTQSPHPQTASKRTG